MEVQADPAKVEELVNEEVAKATYVPDVQLAATSIQVSKDPALVKKRNEEKKRAEKEAALAAKEAEKKAALAAKEAEKAAKQNTASTSTSNTGSSNSGGSGTKASGNFFLIAGAFSSESNAHNRIKQLKKEGYSNATMVGQNEKGYYLVSYKSFSSRSQAESYMPEIKSKGLSTWIYPPAK